MKRGGGQGTGEDPPRPPRLTEGPPGTAVFTAHSEAGRPADPGRDLEPRNPGGREATAPPSGTPGDAEPAETRPPPPSPLGWPLPICATRRPSHPRRTCEGSEGETGVGRSMALEKGDHSWAERRF